MSIVIGTPRLFSADELAQFLQDYIDSHPADMPLFVVNNSSKMVIANIKNEATGDSLFQANLEPGQSIFDYKIADLAIPETGATLQIINPDVNAFDVDVYGFDNGNFSPVLGGTLTANGGTYSFAIDRSSVTTYLINDHAAVVDNPVMFFNNSNHPFLLEIYPNLTPGNIYFSQAVPKGTGVVVPYAPIPIDATHQFSMRWTCQDAGNNACSESMRVNNIWSHTNSLNLGVDLIGITPGLTVLIGNPMT